MARPSFSWKEMEKAHVNHVNNIVITTQGISAFLNIFLVYNFSSDSSVLSSTHCNLALASHFTEISCINFFMILMPLKWMTNFILTLSDTLTVDIYCCYLLLAILFPSAFAFHLPPICMAFLLSPLLTTLLSLGLYIMECIKVYS